MAVYKKGVSFLMMSKAQKKRLLVNIVRKRAGEKVTQYMEQHTTNRVKNVFAAMSLMLDGTIKFNQQILEKLVDDVRFEMNWRVL